MKKDDHKKEDKHPFYWKEEPSRMSGADVEDLMSYCVRIGASDITIQTEQPIWVEIYGKLYPITKRIMSTAETAEIIIALSKAEGVTGTLSSGKDLDFSFEMKPEREIRLRFRVNATAISLKGGIGYQLTIRTIPGIPPDIKTLKVEPEILNNCTPKQGLVLITGATGSGKSTLLAGILRWMAEDPLSNRKILTYESPIEFVYDEVDKPSTVISQTEIPKNLPTFADGVRNALRRKPMVILVGEARDAETIGECVTASMTGHLTFSTVHSNGVADTIRRMINVFPEGEKHARAIDIITSLKLIVSQMLIPSTDGKRVAIREYLVFNETVVDKLLEGGVEMLTHNSRLLVKKHGQTFLSDATAKFKEGKISEYEFKKIKALYSGMDQDSTVGVRV